MITVDHPLPIRHQVQLLELSRSAVYYRAVPVPDSDLTLMRRIDELHLEHAFADSRMLSGCCAAKDMSSAAVTCAR